MTTVSDRTGISSSSSSILSHNPNERKNRVPTESELKALRALVSSNNEVAIYLDERIQTLQFSYTALSNRILQHQRDLEAMQSELTVMEMLVESFQSQRSTLAKGTEEITALLHPVRRIPTEILRHIFELTVGMSESGIWEAMRLSGVCKGWRETAFDSPRIWTSIETTAFEDSPTSWSQCIPLMKKLPVDVEVCGIEEDGLARFRKWHLSKIPNLWKLALNFASTTNTNTIFEALFGPSYSPLSDIEIISSTPLEVHHEKLILQFPGVIRLTLDGNVALRFQEVTSTCISTLILVRMEDVDIRSLLRHLPQLETLELIDVKLGWFQGPLNTPWSNLRSLKSTGTPLFAEEWARGWRLLRLVSLYNGDVPTGIFVEFVKSHPKIQELDCFTEEEQLMQYIPVLTAVTYLSMSPSDVFAHWRENGLQEVPFPWLKVLTFDSTDEWLDTSEFETTVRARCLPKNHPKSLLEEGSQLLSEFRVLVGDRDWAGDLWTRHGLALEASMEVIPYPEVEGWFYVALRWSA